MTIDDLRTAILSGTTNANIDNQKCIGDNKFAIGFDATGSIVCADLN